MFRSSYNAYKHITFSKRLFRLILMDIRWSLVLLLFNVVFLRAQESVEVAAGSTVNLQCKPSTNAPMVPTTYEWVDPQNRVRGTNENLIISDFSYENQGVYTCRASQNVGGVTTKNEKSILVRIKGQAFERQSLEVNVPAIYDTYAGGILFLQCKSSAGDEKNLHFEWINPSGSTEPTPSFFKNTVRLQDSGRYTCRVKRLSDGVVAEGSTMVMVNPLPIKIEQVSGNLRVGETVKLKCSIDKLRTENKVYTSFLYSWLDPMNRVISNKDEVDITLGDVSTFGKYRCKVSSVSMIPPYTQMQDIELRYSNEIVGGGRNVGERVVTTYTGSFSSNPQTLRYFNSLELNCRVHPYLAHVSYQIFFNTQLLTTSNTHVIPRLGKEHLGVYTCHINGKDVLTGRDVTLKTEFSIQPDFKTINKIELTNPPGPQMFVRAGDKRELHCEIPTSAGVHGRDAIWYFNGKEITTNDVETYELQVLPRLYVSIIVLKNIQVINEGKYECKVKGEIKEAYVLVMAKAKHIEVSPADEVRRTGDNRPLEFHCRIGGYRTKNKDIIWTFKSKETNQITSLDSRWVRSDDRTADETSFVVLPQAELQDAGAYICTEPVTGDTAQGILNVISDLRIVVTPPILRLRTGQTATFQCYVMNAGRSGGYPDFVLANGARASDNQRISIEKLEPGKVQLRYRALTASDNGTKFTCRQGRAAADVLVFVDPVCSAGYRLCRNGECISSAKFCDGKRDCADGSDEDKVYCDQCDPLSKRCENHNGQVPSNPIFQAHWSCDGEDDCGNGFDESNCFGHVLECGGLSHRCNDGTKSIPKAFLCDKDSDCANGDDESRCRPPTIMSEDNSAYSINARKGETVTLRCQISGFPLPKVVWRYNWGCLTDSGRMVVTESYRNCQDTVSILTISNFQPGDDGIYNCEGLSGGRRAWSKDYQLMVDLRN